MEAPEVWTATENVRSFQTDKSGKLHFHSIAHLLQENAWRHAEACGVGYADLKKAGKLWILSGLKIKVYNYPMWGEKIILHTWGNSIEGLFAYRDFKIFSETEEVLIAASTSWLIIDVNTHRPNRISREFQKIPCMGIYSGSGQPGRLTGLNDGLFIRSSVVQNSDIDIYQHVNNARYIEWCTNLIPYYLWEGLIIDELEINYLSESHIGNEIAFFMENLSETFYRISAVNNDTKKEVFRSNLMFRKKDQIKV